MVLPHGSLATAAEEWVQRLLADENFHLLAPGRRGYERRPAAGGEDFLRGAKDIAPPIGDGAHLVGHSYGASGSCSPPPAVPRRPCHWPFSSRQHSR